MWLQNYCRKYGAAEDPYSINYQMSAQLLVRVSRSNDYYVHKIVSLVIGGIWILLRSLILCNKKCPLFWKVQHFCSEIWKSGELQLLKIRIFAIFTDKCLMWKCFSFCRAFQRNMHIPQDSSLQLNKRILETIGIQTSSSFVKIS